MVLVRISIGEFEQFWSVFTAAGADRRREHGSRGARVFRNDDDPHEVWILFDWDRAAIDAFLADPAVGETMRSGGATGRPDVRFLDEPRDLPV